MRYFTRLFYTLLTIVFINSCSDNTTEDPTESPATDMNDPHSFSQPDEAVITHLIWEANINFDEKIIEATASYEIKTAENADTIILDTRDLTINKVTVDDQEVDFALGATNKFMGQPLSIPISSTSKKVSVNYVTSPEAAALQWLSPSQTAGKENPFLFTQSQAILARTWIPIQDSPGIRFSYKANVKVPEGLMAVMSASNPTAVSNEGTYEMLMPQPIPAYLMALAVGDLTFKEIGPRTGVYAEPSMVEKSAAEFEDMEKMLITAEELYGKYAWDRYDVIVLPPSFPFGGMENPRLTFATPTILAGDKSLTSLIAHELAHSWSGNVVTNATWDDFWLNEGFTVYFENRIMEALYGADYANMLRLLGYQSLSESVESMGRQNPDTELKLDLAGRDPDEGMTDIAYEKGSFFLSTIENAVGREKFDTFLKNYFDTFGFKGMTTEKFMTYLKGELLTNDSLINAVKPDEWVYGPGIPSNIVIPESDRFEKVEAESAKWQAETPADQLETQNWSTHEWLHFLKNLPDNMSNEQMAELDRAFGFTSSGNSEILGIWFIHVVNNKYQPGYESLENFLVNVGRRKFLTPIYGAMARDADMKKMAKNIYALAKPNYHSVSYLSVDKILE